MPGGKHVLGQSRERHIFGTVKVGEKGQIVIPKEARMSSAFNRETRCSCSATRRAASWSRGRRSCATWPQKFSTNLMNNN